MVVAICRSVHGHSGVLLAAAEAEPLMAYALAHVDSKNVPGGRDRDAHDYLRRRVVGKQVEVVEQDGGTYSVRTVPEGADLTCELFRQGLAQPVDEAALPEPYAAAWQSRGPPSETNVPVPAVEGEEDVQRVVRELIAQKSEHDAVIDKVLAGNKFECFFPKLGLTIIVCMTGVECPHGYLAKEAKTFMEIRILQRDLTVRLDGQCSDERGQTQTYGTFLHRQKGLVSEYVLKEGLGTIDVVSLKLLRLAQQEVLKNAATSAAQRKVKVWSPAHAGHLLASANTSASSTPTKIPPKASGDVSGCFYAKVVDIISATSLIVLQGKDYQVNAGKHTPVPVTPYDKHHFIYLSHLRSQNRGWLSATRKLITKYVGKAPLVLVQIDFARYPAVEFGGQPSDEYGRLHYASIYKLDSNGLPTGHSLNLEMVKQGLATVELIRDQRTSKDYELLLQTFRELQSGSNPVSIPPTEKHNDLIGPMHSKRARQMFTAIKNDESHSIVIEKIVMGHKFRAYLESYNTMISITLSGITCPQTADSRQTASEFQEENVGQPYSQECLKWSQIELLFNRYKAVMTNCDPSGTFGVILTDKDDVTVQDKMLEAGMAMVFDRYPGPLEEHHRALETKAIAEGKGIWSLADNIVFFGRGEDKAKTESLLGNWGSVNVSHCESCREVYVQKHSESSELSDVQRLIADEMKMTDASECLKLTEFPPAINSIVLAQYEDAWYRARVLNVDTLGQVRVFFLDYGNQSTIDEHCLAMLPPACNVIAYTPLAHKVSLAYIKNPSILPDALEGSCDLIMDFGEDATCQCDCVSINRELSCPDVVLTRQGRDLINELLVVGLVKLRSRYNNRKFINNDALKRYKATEDTARGARLGIWLQGDIGDTDDEE